MASSNGAMRRQDPRSRWPISRVTSPRDSGAGDPPAGDAAGDPRDPVPVGEGAVKPPPFTYHAPASLTEALGLLRSLENARLLAGGQSLMPMMNMRYAQPDHIIDINN